MNDASNTLTDQPNSLSRLTPNYKLWISIAILVIPVTLVLVIAFADLSETTSNQLVSLLIFSSLLIFDSYRRFIANPSQNSPVTLVDSGQYSTTYVYGNYSVASQQNVKNYEQQNLVDAAREIQKLLKEVSSDYSASDPIVTPSPRESTDKDTSNSESSQMANGSTSGPESETVQTVELAAKVIERVERDPSLKQRAIEALKQGGLEALKSTSAGLIIAAVIEGWAVDD
ncbi:MAG: hypothetical protein F6K30_14485 [Cyanothece sp. SIO2G6]|nr:hypothetical protein [Cyanothece sp. SIO2G6]